MSVEDRECEHDARNYDENGVTHHRMLLSSPLLIGKFLNARDLKQSKYDGCGREDKVCINKEKICRASEHLKIPVCNRISACAKRRHERCRDGDSRNDVVCLILTRLADDARDASICIFDMTGNMLKNLPISSGETSVSINGWELGDGMFLYTLIVNGKEIDTKRMIITK